MPFAEERWAFGEFGKALRADDSLRTEYERAIKSVVREYNTSIYENRFVTGGAVELFTQWAMRAAGIDVNLVGAQLSGADIQLPRGGRISIKSSFTDPPGSISLINVRGESSSARWADSTIFVLAKLGIGYADPEILPDATRRTSDAIVLPWPRLRHHLEMHPELVSDVDIPVKSRLTAGSKVASRAVAIDVIQSLGLRRLRSGFPE